MGYKKRKSPSFIVEIDGSLEKSALFVERREQADLVGAPRKAYLYKSDERKVAVGFRFDKALRFSSAELAITYVSRNEVSRSIRPFVKIERLGPSSGNRGRAGKRVSQE